MPDLPLSTSGKTAAQVAHACAQRAGRIIMAAFPGLTGVQSEVSIKGRGNFVTETDLAAEHATLDILRREYPDHHVLAEEAQHAESPAPGPESRAEWLWVVDPLDGTHNFALGIPHFAFSIALCRDREPVLGLTFAPATGEEYLAQQGQGLTVRGKPAHASRKERVEDGMLGIGLGYDDLRARRVLELATDLWPMEGLRDMGSATLGFAYAASGRFDVFVHHSLYPWDVAAGIVLVREGGGAIVDRDGGAVSIDSEGAIAGAPRAVAELVERVKGRPWRE
jgi:fructose-1,6-bisphosphatase/inositol monophosphatase family enzyme